MSEDLQSLLDKINRDGVEKARSEAEAIIAKAREDAAAIVKAAKDEAAAMREESAKAAEADVQRATKSISQAARDTIVKVEEAVKQLLKNILETNVDKALGDEKTVAALAAKVVEEFVAKGDVEIAARKSLANALKSALASKNAVTVVMDETLGKGFSVKLDGGRVEYLFTSEVIAEELAKRLRPELAKLVKG